MLNLHRDEKYYFSHYTYQEIARNLVFDRKLSFNTMLAKQSQSLDSSINYISDQGVKGAKVGFSYALDASRIAASLVAPCSFGTYLVNTGNKVDKFA